MLFSFLDILVSTRKKGFPVLKKLKKKKQGRKEEGGREKRRKSQSMRSTGGSSEHQRKGGVRELLCVCLRLCPELHSSGVSTWQAIHVPRFLQVAPRGRPSPSPLSTSTLVWQCSHQLCNQFLF